MNHTYKIKSHFWTLVSVPIIIQYDVFWSSSFCSWFSATFSAFQSSLFHANFLYFLPSNQDSCALLPPFSPGSIANPPRAWLGNNFGLDRLQFRLCWLCWVHFCTERTLRWAVWVRRMVFSILTPRQMNSKSGIKKNTCVSLAQLLYWMPNIFRLQSTGLFKVSYFCSSLNNLVKLWFKEDKHKYIKDKWSQKLYCSLLFISKL